MANFMKFRVTGDNLDFDELIQTFQIEDVTVCKKGNTYYDRVTKKTLIFKEDCLVLNKGYREDVPLDNVINEFISQFLPHKAWIKDIMKDNHLMFWLALYPDDRHINVCISPRTLSKLKSIGIELNIEASFLKDIYEGTY